VRIAKVVAALAIMTLGATGCSAGVEGTYKFDQVETTKAISQELAKTAKGLPMPPGVAFLATTGLDRLEWTIELQAGGQVNMTTRLLGSRREADVTRGTWKMEGRSIVLTGDGRSLPAAGSKAIKCAKSSANLRCGIGNDNEVPLIFTKS
jgi:hypothetical protein